MRNLVATRKGYVRRLRQMLNREDACECCPLVTGFKAEEGCKYQECTDVTEEWCHDFIGIGRYIQGDCPCVTISNAPTLARKALALWDKGEHRWQEEKLNNE